MVKYRKQQGKKSWLRKIPKFDRFGVMVFSTFLVTLIAWRVASMLAPVMIVGAIAFVGYKLYLEGDDED